MRRVFGYVAFVIGLMLIFLVPFLLLYTVPRVEKTPTDVDNTVISDGVGNYFSATKLQYLGPTPLQSIERYKGDPSESTSDVVVIDYGQHLVVLATGESIDYDQEVFAMNRSTGYAEHCCGEKPVHTGVELKFPFDTQQQTYPLWDNSANRAFPAKYVRTDTVDGLQAYVFESESGPYKIGTIDIPASYISPEGKGLATADRMYDASTLAWVEPTTGAIIKGSRHVQQWAASNGQKVLALADLQVTYTPETVAKLSSDAKNAKDQLHMLKVTIPIVSLVLGIGLTVLAVFLLRKPPAAEKKAPAAATPKPVPA